MVSKIFFSSNLVGRIFFYGSARIFFYYICAACNFFLPTSACRKFFFKITHPLPQELNGRPLSYLLATYTTVFCLFVRSFVCFVFVLRRLCINKRDFHHAPQGRRRSGSVGLLCNLCTCYMFAMSDEHNYRCRVLIFIYLTFVCRHRKLRSVCVSFDISKQLLRVSQNLISDDKKGSERDLSFPDTRG